MKPEYIFKYINNPDEIFEELLKLEWLSVTEARKEYFMSEKPVGYIYGAGLGKREYLSKPYLPSILSIQDRLNKEFSCDYNLCFLNRYDTQQNQLNWHADDSPTMNMEHPISVISFGAVREIWWKPQQDKGPIPLDQRQKLGHGSLFIMGKGFQKTMFHRIPKCDRECGIRISLTFRNYINLPESS